MAKGSDLMAFGMPPDLARSLGNDDSALTCTGTSQATAATIKSHNVTLTAASSQTGAILPSTALVGTPYYVNCTSSTSAVVYAPASTTLNGSASTSGLTVAQNKAAILIQTSKGVWVSILTA